MYKKFLRMNQRGFTLNELLVVIAIIGILSGIVIASLNPARESGKNAKITSDIGQYVMAFRLLKEKEGLYPNPGGGTQTYCLSEDAGGTPCNTGTTNPTVNTALGTVMGILPSSKDKVGNIYWGYKYNCGGGGNKCSSYKLEWALYGKNSDCSPGIPILVADTDPYTRCKYESK